MRQPRDDSRQIYTVVQTDEPDNLSALEAPPEKHTLRVAAVGLAVTVAFAIITCSAINRYGDAATRSMLKGSINGLVNFESAPVPPWIKPKAELCNIAIVVDVCLRVNQSSGTSYGKNLDIKEAWVTSKKLSEFFMVSLSSIEDYLSSIGVPMKARTSSGYKVRCTDLCQKTVASFGSGVLPHEVDVGCFYLSIGDISQMNPCLPIPMANGIQSNTPAPAQPAQPLDSPQAFLDSLRGLWGRLKSFRLPKPVNANAEPRPVVRTLQWFRSAFKSLKCGTLALVSKPADSATYPSASAQSVSAVQMLPMCSVDVSTIVLRRRNMPVGNNTKGLRQFLERPDTKLTASQNKSRSVIDDVGSLPAGSSGWQASLEQSLYKLSLPVVTFDQMQLSVARLFRIFPASKNVSVQVAPEPVAKTVVSAQRRLWDDSCSTAKDGFCDVPLSCADRTDCTDCGDCDGRVPDDSCIYHNDDVCDEPRYCLEGTDCTDCDTCGFGGDKAMRDLKKSKPNDSCKSANDGTCDAPPLCEEGTDCTDCNTCRKGGQHYQPSQYGVEILTAGVETSALVSKALLGVHNGEGSEIITKFIGKDIPLVRAELKRVMAATVRMLDNVFYVYPGNECRNDTYGYVHVDTPPRQGGKYTYFLCKMYMQANAAAHVMTLLETGMHEQDMLAETILLDGQPVYGRTMVKKLAAKCRDSAKDDKMTWCWKAARNSQSILYVIDGFANIGL